MIRHRHTPSTTLNPASIASAVRRRAEICRSTASQPLPPILFSLCLCTHGPVARLPIGQSDSLVVLKADFGSSGLLVMMLTDADTTSPTLLPGIVEVPYADRFRLGSIDTDGVLAELQGLLQPARTLARA
jgi:hypothetical protein